jgi:hypothetical protein
VASDLSVEKRLTFTKLRRLIQSRRLSTVESTLEVLHQEYPEYLSFHTLMYKSLSLHESSFTEPRAIVFGPDAKFILTFNGNRRQRGGNAIEVVEYNEQLKQFEFREIAFSYGNSAAFGELGLRRDEILIRNRGVLISKPNPRKCQQCHGQNNSPIWASYFVWPGAYGSNDDHLTFSFHKNNWNANNLSFFENADRPHSQGRLMELRDGVPDRELQGMVEYVQNKPNHPRYKWLPRFFYERLFFAISRVHTYKTLIIPVRLKTKRKACKQTLLLGQQDQICSCFMLFFH